MKQWTYCPHCAGILSLKPHGRQSLLRCECGFTHYDNPIPVVVCLIPKDGGIVCVKRKNAPFKGEWALPGGFMDQHGHPKAEACREALEETGLIVRVERILCACNPMPGEVNQTIISYLARVTGGELRAGDDAEEVAVFQKDNFPHLCFRSHRMMTNNWFNGVYGELTGRDLEW